MEQPSVPVQPVIQPPRKNPLVIGIIALVIVLLLVCGTLMFFLVKKNTPVPAPVVSPTQQPEQSAQFPTAIPQATKTSSMENLAKAREQLNSMHPENMTKELDSIMNTIKPFTH